MTRLLYTPRTGKITSKTGAGRYALDACPARWHPIIREAMRCRPIPLVHGPQAAGAARRSAAAKYMEFVIASALRSGPDRHDPLGHSARR